MASAIGRMLEVVPGRSRSRSRSRGSNSDRPQGSSAGSSGGGSSSRLGNVLFDLPTSQDGFSKLFKPDAHQDYEVRGKIGEGSFGVVFEGYNFKENKTVAIKVIKQQRVKWVKREIYILSLLAGKPNIAELLDVILDAVTDVPAFVFDYVENEHWSQLYPKLDFAGVRSYARQLLNALHHCRVSVILHRDIKPANILYDCVKHHLVLIDWGTADIFHPEKNCGYLVGTREFRSPELLMQCVRYDFSVDMWSAGCVLGQLFLGREPLFGVAESNGKQLLKLVARYGSEAVKQCLNQGQEKVREPEVWKTAMDILSSSGVSPPIEWSDLGAKTYHNRIKDCQQHGLLTLLDDILKLDPSARLLPSDALKRKCWIEDNGHPMTVSKGLQEVT